MSKKQPHKRLGRGLDGLINGSLGGASNNKTPPPSVEIDSLRIQPASPQPKYRTPQSGNENIKDPVAELNKLLKQTQDEAAEAAAQEMDEAMQDVRDTGAEGEKIIPADEVAEHNVKKPVFKKFDNAANSSQQGASVGTGQGVFMLIPLKAIKVSPYQRRKEFAPEALKDLADSIRSEGLMQPIVVRGTGDGYELIAGERRWRACESIGMEVIPARVVSVANISAAVMGLIENLQRENLNPVEEARGYGMLLTDFHLTQEQMAERVGKPRSTIANSLRLMLLEPEILGYLSKGQISTGHAKVLLGLPEGPERVMLARTIVEQGLSVRGAEALIRKGGAVAKNASAKRLASTEEMAAIADLQKRLVARLNTKVALNHSAKGGKIVVHYKSNAELEEILKKIGLA